ncbi:MAG: patatin-like phospholipase family protein [Bacteroidales bacterium]|nr:patatin-like phospholipase family protein [Bacteroidales bacterium]
MKNVALALSSGGPRGFAYIGAIEVLQERGYTVTSVSGASAGALVGGIFAAGGLDAFKEWLYGLDPVKVVSLMDFTPSRNYLVKGDRVIRAIRQRVPDVRIDDLPIPFTAVATDLYTGEEVVFREGPLFDAIRASISIPSMFRPVRWQGRTLIDGGLSNTFPLNRVHRSGNDILVGFNVNRINAEEIGNYLETKYEIAASEEALREEAEATLRGTLASDADLLSKVRTAGEQGSRLIRGRFETEMMERRLQSVSRAQQIPVGADGSYVSILQRSFGIMNHTIARMGIDLCPPDILVDLPFDSYHGVYGYSHAEEIARKGRELMVEALDRYEAENPEAQA